MSISPPSSVIAKLHFASNKSSVQPRVTYSGTSDKQHYNEAYYYKEVPINNARLSDKNYALDINGFQCSEFETRFDDYENEEAITQRYYDDVRSLVTRETGAPHVFIFDHTIRRGKPDSVRLPAQHIHNDYTERTAIERSTEMLSEDIMQKFSGKRMIQINVWRSIAGTVEQNPLAVCDAQSINKNDLIAAQIEFMDNDHIGEIYALHHNPNQRWNYFPYMSATEALLIKGYDSQNNGAARFTPHTAFADPTSQHDAKPRESIETRTFAFFD